MTQKTQSNKNKKTIIAIVVVGILVTAGVVWAIITYGPGLNNQTQDTFVPNLQTDLQLNDNQTNAQAPFLHVEGTVQNTGNGTANNIIMHIYAIQSGNATAIDTTVTLDPIVAGSTQTIDLNFSYTGEALLAYFEPTLDYTN